MTLENNELLLTLKNNEGQVHLVTVEFDDREYDKYDIYQKLENLNSELEKTGFYNQENNGQRKFIRMACEQGIVRNPRFVDENYSMLIRTFHRD